MEEWIGEYLLSQGLQLTALELREELREMGKPTIECLESFVATQISASAGGESSEQQSEVSDGRHSRGDIVEDEGPTKSKEKETVDGESQEKIAVLEHTNRRLESENEILRSQLSAVMKSGKDRKGPIHKEGGKFAHAVATKRADDKSHEKVPVEDRGMDEDGGGAGRDEEESGDDGRTKDDKEIESEEEKHTIMCLIGDYLLHHDFPFSSIQFVDEAGVTQSEISFVVKTLSLDLLKALRVCRDRGMRVGVQTSLVPLALVDEKEGEMKALRGLLESSRGKAKRLEKERNEWMERCRRMEESVASAKNEERPSGSGETQKEETGQKDPEGEGKRDHEGRQVQLDSKTYPPINVSPESSGMRKGQERTEDKMESSMEMRRKDGDGAISMHIPTLGVDHGGVSRSTSSPSIPLKDIRRLGLHPSFRSEYSRKIHKKDGKDELRDESERRLRYDEAGGDENGFGKREFEETSPIDSPFQQDIWRSRVTALSHTLSSQLPVIAPNVLVKRRGDLIPLFQHSIEMQSDATKRAPLITSLLNLYKRPNVEQRKEILSCVEKILRVSASSSAEEEFFPPLWEQMTHKFVERRVFVAEACRVIAPFTSPLIASSLVLSILDQMSEDSEIPVRQAVLQSFVTVLPLVADSEKSRSIFSLMRKLLFDHVESISTDTVKKVVPAVVSWCETVLGVERMTLDLWVYMLDTLASLLGCQSSSMTPDLNIGHGSTRFGAFGSLPQTPLSSTSSSSKGPTFENTENAKKVCSALVAAVPSLEKMLAWVVEEHRKLLVAKEDKEALVGELLPLIIDHLNCDPHVHSPEDLDGDGVDVVDEADSHKEDMSFMTDANSPITRFLMHGIMSRMVDIIFVELDDGQFLKDLGNLLFRVGDVLGTPYVISVMRPQLMGKLMYDPLHEREMNEEEMSGRGRLLLLYTRNVLPLEGVAGMRTYLRELLVDVSFGEGGWRSQDRAIVEDAIGELAAHETLGREVVSVLWDLLVHPSANVRIELVQVLRSIISLSKDPAMISQTILPAVLTLSSDIDHDTRVQAIQSFSLLLINVPADLLLEKIVHHFDVILSEPTSEYAIELISTVKSVIPSVPIEFRDSYWLPHLAHLSVLVAQNASGPNPENWRNLGHHLLESFQACAGCLLSAEIVQNQLLAGVMSIAHATVQTSEGDGSDFLLTREDMERAESLLHELQELVPSSVDDKRRKRKHTIFEKLRKKK